MDMTRWEWIPRFLNAYIDARVQDEVKKRIREVKREDSAASESDDQPNRADIQTIHLPKKNQPKPPLRKSAARYTESKRKRTADTASVAGKSRPSFSSPPRTARPHPVNHKELLRELRETRRYLERLEAQLVQITHKEGYTDFLDQQPPRNKPVRRPL